MKLKKVRITGILLVAALFALSSCSLIFNENVDTDLSELAAFATGLDTAVRLLANDADIAESRTVNPGSYNGGTIVIGATPAVTYPGGSNLVNFPSDASYVENFYGNPSLTAKFSMKPVGSNYEIKLFVYDAANFLLDYVYEEYYVSGTSWAPLKADGTTPGYIDYYDKMHDGSKIQHNEYAFGPDGGKVWNISVPAVISDNLADYSFTVRSDKTAPSLFDGETEIQAPTRGPVGGFDSYKESTGNYQIEAVSRKAPKRPDFESITYYAELDNQKKRNMVVFSLQEVDKEKDSYARGVTRSHEEFVSDDNDTPADTSDDFLTLSIKNQLNLISIAKKGDDPWQHIATNIGYSIVGGLINVDHTEDVYYEDSLVNGFPDKKTTMELVQVSGSVNNFAGTMTVEKTGKKTENYTVTYDGKNFKTKKNKSRAVSADDGIELDLSLLENGTEFTLNLPGGSIFEGTYYNGRLTGSVKYRNGDLKSIDILSGVILLDDELWVPEA